MLLSGWKRFVYKEIRYFKETRNLIQRNTELQRNTILQGKKVLLGSWSTIFIQVNKVNVMTYIKFTYFHTMWARRSLFLTQSLRIFLQLKKQFGTCYNLVYATSLTHQNHLYIYMLKMNILSIDSICKNLFLNSLHCGSPQYSLPYCFFLLITNSTC